MFHDQVEPILKELSSEVLYSDVVKIDCMGESKVAEEIEDLIENRQILQLPHMPNWEKSIFE